MTSRRGDVLQGAPPIPVAIWTRILGVVSAQERIMVSLFCPHRETNSRILVIVVTGERARFSSISAKSLIRQSLRRCPLRVCKTSIPGSNPGGASNSSQRFRELLRPRRACCRRLVNLSVTCAG